MEPSYQEELIHASLCYTPAVYDSIIASVTPFHLNQMLLEDKKPIWLTQVSPMT